ncbi:MAG TPA: hypothetical protein VLS93_12225, partial [Anaeromyxobacteraceae bacterium]|nr:hypothetical protein [Anaeromyxobacteraceae bacterium]
LGVLALVLLGALYGGGGLALVVWLKTGVFGAGPVASAALAAAAFAPIYAAMILSAVLVRSAALSALAGGATWILGIVAGSRETLAPIFREGLGRDLFLAATAPLPRISELGRAGARVAEGLPPEGALLAAQVGAAAVFALALLAVAVGLFERKDF